MFDAAAGRVGERGFMRVPLVYYIFMLNRLSVIIIIYFLLTQIGTGVDETGTGGNGWRR